MEHDYNRLQNALIAIASESFRFRQVFEKAVSKLETDEQNKYTGQYLWFSRRVDKALEAAGMKLLNLEGQVYDPGMAVTPLNIDDFDADDPLYVQQMVEPIVMQADCVFKTGTVILGRIEG